MNAAANVAAKFPVRNVEFEIDENTIPKYWYRSRRAVTIFFNNLSTLFPLGEEFFIKSMLPYKGQIKDQQLLAEIKAFSGQEGMHTREHIRYNEMLKKQGYRVDAIEKGVARLLSIPRLTGPLRNRVRLAATAALEHWTGMLAHFVLADDTILDGAHPVMAGVWRWHAAEESEHKAVSFDVYEQTGGGYVIRVGVQLLASAIFWARVMQQQYWMMQDDGIQWEMSEWLDLAKFAFVEQRMVQRLGPLYLEYFRPDFHPWHIEDSHLLEKWKLDYEKNPVYKKRIKKQPKIVPPLETAPAPA